MTPIDDELRALLHDRAADVSPAPDPLGGIASRARGLRRRRALAAVSSAAVVVAAVAVAVPLSLSGGGGTTVGTPGATATATGADSYALEPAHPWDFRGQALTNQQKDGCGCNPLYALQQGHWTYVFGVSTHPARPGLVFFPTNDTLLGETQPVVSPLPSDLRVLQWVMKGDTPDTGRLVVVAAPGSLVQFAQDGSTDYQQISDVGQAPQGVGLVPIEGRTPGNRIRVTEPDGTRVEQPAAVWTPVDTSTPANVLTWVHRGDRQSISDATVLAAYLQSEPGSGAHYRSLYDGTRNGIRITIGQAWHDGDDGARAVAYDTDGVNSEFFLGPVTPRNPWVLAGLVPDNGKDLLILLPRPGAGRVGYSPTATGAFTDVASGRSDLDPVGLVDRDPKALGDRVQVHQGDDSVVLTAPVATLTCGAKECG